MKFTAFLHRVIIGKNDRAEQIESTQPAPIPETSSQSGEARTSETEMSLQNQQIPLQDHGAAAMPLPENKAPKVDTNPVLPEQQPKTALSNLDRLISQLNPSQRLLLENFAQQLIDKPHVDKVVDKIPTAYPEQPQVPSSSQADDMQQSSEANDEEQAKALQTSQFISSLAQATEEQTYSRANVDFYKKQAAQEEIRIPDRDARLDKLRQIVASSVANPQDLGRLIASNSF